MAKYKIGITEAGDAGIDLSWTKKLDAVDGAIVITKNMTNKFLDSAIEFKDKLIVHATLTGFGGSVLEPFVPYPHQEQGKIMELIQRGFPKEKIVIRIDPIIPSTKGCSKALLIMKAFIKDGFSRFRVSVIDMYPHARDRFKRTGLPCPYGEGFAPSIPQLEAVDKIIAKAKEYHSELWGDSKPIRIESCAEPGLKEPIACGCISDYDLALLNLNADDSDGEYGFQRKNCLCYPGKTELLTRKRQCINGCLYCYWKDE